MVDIVERLRKLKTAYEFSKDPYIGPEAASEIKQLREENNDLTLTFLLLEGKAATEIERWRGVFLTVLEACEDVNSPDRKVRKEITRTVGKALNAITVQANAVRVLHEAETSELNRLRKNAQEAYTAKATLDSEREANKILTDEIERLREALAFYAEWGIDAPAVDAIIEEDCGDKARAALNIVLGEEE